METREWNHFISKFKIMVQFHTLFDEIIESDLNEPEEEYSALFKYLKDIDIKSDAILFEAFINLLPMAFYRPSKKNLFSKLKRILTELQIHPYTLFDIFQDNDNFILYLFEEGLIDLNHLEERIKNHQNAKFLFYFSPEIFKYKILTEEKLIKYLKKLLPYRFNDRKLISKILIRFKEEVIIPRKKGHCLTDIAQIVRNDDIKLFMQYISQQPFCIDEIILDPAFESDEVIRNENNGITVLEYSMCFGSINIFKYLWLNHAKYTEKSLQYSIIGGNYDIIHILEEESIYKFDENAIEMAIRYQRYEILDYLINTLNVNVETSQLIFYYCKSFNYKKIEEIIKKYSEMKQPEITNTIIRKALFNSSGRKRFFYDFLFNLDINNRVNDI
ncbi:hypothetical protein TRFO_35226 [Tritrichomonas foetus]|uniref:DUF3447 domain-containing protein n=1 Tax=Tritrichomonas foetus TaxID=1144522 RepID=A0A1J4JLG4_9EUKA|nr:hypothetical protein TRFO_35226 [Tritrichomonas foetus]|eukprot:OHS98403.1 hypothetical protein TRFO_35226 [Tritrichomonas foetus]